MVITQSQLIRAVPDLNKKRLNEFVASFNMWAIHFDITTPVRVVHYLAQVFKESGALYYTEEIASGAAYDTGKLAQKLGNTPAKDEDGQKYKGRGYIQLTGLNNYKAFNNSDFCTEDVIKHPEKLKNYPLNQVVSMWFWKTNNLNALADKDDKSKNGEAVVEQITRVVNGGKNGLADRKYYYKRFKKEFF